MIPAIVEKLKSPSPPSSGERAGVRGYSFTLHAFTGFQ
jgi:hypothetical protein